MGRFCGTTAVTGGVDMLLLKLVGKVIAIPLALVLAFFLGMVKLIIGICSFFSALSFVLLGALLVMTLCWFEGWLQVGFVLALAGAVFVVFLTGMTIEALLEDLLSNLTGFIFS